MKRGKWFLTYTDYNEMESMGNEIESVEVALDSATEDEAIAEAKMKWEDRVAKANAYWEKQKKEWAHPPSGPFHGISPRPCVIYKIQL